MENNNFMGQKLGTHHLNKVIKVSITNMRCSHHVLDMMHWEGCNRFVLLLPKNVWLRLKEKCKLNATTVPGLESEQKKYIVGQLVSLSKVSRLVNSIVSTLIP